ncbi:MAG: hypothetical protein K1X75_13620 [Leptospirales bacterium]|nr:hypothetical protein [Leptospirales bacterium]
MDREGNRYATRFNLQTRQVEVVRLARNRVEAQRLREQIVRERAAERESRSTGASSSGAFISAAIGSDNADEMDLMDFSEMDDIDMDDAGAAAAGVSAPRKPAGPPPSAGGFYEQKFLDDIVADLGKHRERLTVILNHLRTTRHFDSNGDFQDLLRRVDIDCWQKSEQAIGYYKELFGYPRSLSHYTPRLSAEERTRLEKASSDEARLELIRRWESRRAFEDCLQSIARITEEIQRIVAAVPEAALRMLPAAHQQLVSDSTTSIEVILAEAYGRIQEIADWRNRLP